MPERIKGQQPVGWLDDFSSQNGAASPDNGEANGRHNGGGLVVEGGGVAAVDGGGLAVDGGTASALVDEWRIPWLRGEMPEGESEPRLLSRDTLYRRSLALADVIACAVAVSLAIAVLGQDRLVAGVLLAIPLVVLVSKLIGIYDRDEHLLRKSTLEEAPALFQVATLFTLLLWLADGLAIEGPLGRDQVLGLWGLLFVCMVLARAAMRRLAMHLAPAERCLVLGDTPSADRLEETLRRSRSVKAEVGARLPLAVGRRKGETPPEACQHEPLTAAITRYEVERVIIAPTTADSDDILNAVRMVKAMGVKVSVLPRLFEAVGSSAKFDDVDGTTLLGFPSYWSGPPSNQIRVELVGMPLDPVTEAEAIGHITESLAAGRGGWVITPNLDQLRKFGRTPDVKELFDAADLVVADGMPLKWGSRLAGTPLPARVAGSDLVWSLTAEAAIHDRSVFLIGGSPGAGKRAAAVMRANYPRLRIAGVEVPPYGFEDDPAKVDAIRSALDRAQPDIVYVALGFPRQERLIKELRAVLPNAWFIGVGISFSFLAGDVARAPDWLQRIGLEWVHRLAAEPRRLARRYLADDLPFAARLLAHTLRARARGGLLTRPALYVRTASASGRVTFTHGAIERRRAADVESLTLPEAPARSGRRPSFRRGSGRVGGKR